MTKGLPLAELYFSNSRIEKWEVALQDGQEPISIKDSNVYCYGVDAGLGLFIDPAADKYFKQQKDYYVDEAVFEKAKTDDYKGHIYSSGSYNLASFATGFGDGCYATYIGRDKDRNVCQLLTDFGLIGWRKLKEK